MNRFSSSSRSCFFPLSVKDSGAAEQQAEITVTILLFCPLIRTGHYIYRYDVIHVANETRSICAQSLFSGLMGVSRQGVFLSLRGGELFKDIGLVIDREMLAASWQLLLSIISNTWTC